MKECTTLSIVSILYRVSACSTSAWKESYLTWRDLQADYSSIQLTSPSNWSRLASCWLAKDHSPSFFLRTPSPQTKWVICLPQPCCSQAFSNDANRVQPVHPSLSCVDLDGYLRYSILSSHGPFCSLAVSSSRQKPTSCRHRRPVWFLVITDIRNR